MNRPASRPKLKRIPPPVSNESGKRNREAIRVSGKSGSTSAKKATQFQQLHAEILDSIPDAAWMKDKDGLFLAVNRAWSRFAGKTQEEVLGKTTYEIFGTETTQKLRMQDLTVMQSGNPLRFEEAFTKQDKTFWFDTCITPIRNTEGAVIGTVGIARDITERKQMEEKYLRNQRLESLGSLAGGIAHDLNNILGPIMMSASMLREELPKQTVHELTAIIQEATQRAADIVSQLLAFARGAKGERKILEPHTLIGQVERILKETLPKSITFTASLPQGLWHVTGDMTQLHQVLINLCVNARDAMPKGGSLSLTAENCKITKSFPAFPNETKPGNYLKITVTDTGAGIPEEIMAKIFDPFFTTKESGKGTGLGLPTVLGIVKSHGGFVTLESKVKKGSQFSIYFPATKESLAPVRPQKQSALPEGHGEMVLIVDDEQSICKMAETILTQKGYKIITASGAKEALDLYDQYRAKIKAVITDLAMPEMDGVAFTKALKAIAPSVSVIASTGQSAELRYRELRNLKVGLFLSKPYNAQQLLSIVHQAVCGNTASAL